MKGLIDSVVTAAGFKLIPRWRMRGLPLAHRLIRLFDVYKIDTVIDVGANKGQFRDFLRNEVGFDGPIESFEPIPALLAELKTRAVKDRNWQIHSCALGRQKARLPLNIMKSSDFSSFHQPIQTGTPEQQRRNTIEDRVEVEVDTLDSRMGEKLNDRSIYLKLDTQGFDIDVLMGASKLLSKVPALQTEIAFIPLYEAMPTFEDSIRAFSAQGYSVADMFLVSSDERQRAIEFDCVMVRK